MILDVFINQVRDYAKKDVNLMIENIFDEIANKHQKNPFKLSLTLSKVDEIAIGEMFDENDEKLEQIDAGALIENLFKQQLQVIPQKFHAAILKQLGGDDPNKIVVDLLQDESMVISYDEKFKLVYFKVNESGLHPIDVDYFFENMKF